MKQDFDSHHRAKDLPSLDPGEVYIPDKNTYGYVKEGAGSPRSYVIETPTGDLRRNCRNINLQPQELMQPANNGPPSPQRDATQIAAPPTEPRRSTRVHRAPQKLNL